MMYNVGDKVELESGKIVEITGIGRSITEEGPVYGFGNPIVAITEKIIRKVEE